MPIRKKGSVIHKKIKKKKLLNWIKKPAFVITINSSNYQARIIKHIVHMPAKETAATEM